MSIVYCEFECEGTCENCNWWNEECGCLLRPCNKDKLEELTNDNR